MASLALATTCLFHRRHRIFYRGLSLPPQVSGLRIRKSSRSIPSSSSILKRLYPIKARMTNQHVVVKPVVVCIYSLFCAFSYFLPGCKRVSFAQQQRAISQDSRIEMEEPVTSQGKVGGDPRLLKIQECLRSMSHFLELEAEEMEYDQAMTYARGRVQNLDSAWKIVEEMMREDSRGQDYTCMEYWKMAYNLYQYWISTYKQQQEWIETTANFEAASKERYIRLHRDMLSIVYRLEKQRERIMTPLLEEAPRDTISDDLLLNMDWPHMKDFIRCRIEKLDRDEEKTWTNLRSSSNDGEGLRNMYYICDSKTRYGTIKWGIDIMEQQMDLLRISHMKVFKNFYVQNKHQEEFFYETVELLLKGGREEKN